MPYLGTSPVDFPSFERSRSYFRTGIGGPPAARYSEPPQLERWGGSSQRIARASTGAGGGGGITSPTPTTPQAPSPVPQQPTQAPQAEQPATQQAAPQVVSTAPYSAEQQAQPYTPPTVGYGNYQGGSLQSALFNPVQSAAQQGISDVERFAEQFRQQAGPSRTYEGIGGEQTLSQAVEGGPMEPARALVQAQYQGPAGLDPNAVGGLQFLQGQLEQRQQNLGTGAGLASTIGQTVQDLTPGEARFEAQHMFTPEYRQALQAAMAPVGQFGEQLSAETTGAQEFAAQRGAEETEIARRAAEYLTGRRSGIQSDIDAAIAEAQQRQVGASKAYQDIISQTGDISGTIEALRRAQEGGFLEGGTADQFMTPATTALAGSGAARDEILNDPRFATLKDVPIGEIGMDKKGRQTYLINGQDFRTVLGKGEKAQLFKERQAALEEAFDPVRGVKMPSGQRTSGDYGYNPDLQQLVDPLYFGNQLNTGAIQDYLTYDPGVRPSRGNISTDQQMDQYNRINDLLGDLDRISREESPFRAATIAAHVDDYLSNEEQALEQQKGSLDENQQEWFRLVKKTRKKYRKAERESEWGKVGGIVGGVIGAVIGAPIGGPIGGVAGYGIGSSVGTKVGKELA